MRAGANVIRRTVLSYQHPRAAPPGTGGGPAGVRPGLVRPRGPARRDAEDRRL